MIRICQEPEYTTHNKKEDKLIESNMELRPVGPEGRKDGEGLGGVEGGETIIKT